MLLGIISDTVKLAAIGGIVTIFGSLIALATMIVSRKLDSVAKIGKITHDIINGGSIVQLRFYAIAMRRIACLTSAPRDIEAAEMAEKNLKEQEEKQKIAILNNP